MPPLRFHCVGGCWGLNHGLMRLWHWQSDALTTRLDLIHKPELIHLARSHPHSARSHPHYARSPTHSARSHPHSASIHSPRSHPKGEMSAEYLHYTVSYKLYCTICELSESCSRLLYVLKQTFGYCLINAYMYLREIFMNESRQRS
jgi:hypothetical protein